MKEIRISSQIVALLLAVVAACVMAPNIVEAGQMFDPHMAKGGLPECMEKLNSAVSVLEASQEDLFGIASGSTYRLFGSLDEF